MSHFVVVSQLLRLCDNLQLQQSPFKSIPAAPCAQQASQQTQLSKTCIKQRTLRNIHCCRSKCVRPVSAAVMLAHNSERGSSLIMFLASLLRSGRCTYEVRDRRGHAANSVRPATQDRHWVAMVAPDRCRTESWVRCDSGASAHGVGPSTCQKASELQKAGNDTACRELIEVPPQMQHLRAPQCSRLPACKTTAVCYTRC